MVNGGFRWFFPYPFETLPAHIADHFSFQKSVPVCHACCHAFLSHFCHAIQEEKKEKLQKLQNRAARILTSSSYDADAGYLLQQLGWKDLIAQRQIQVALMVFKALNDLVPDYLSSMFTERSTPGYVLRDSTNKLNVPLPRTNYLKKSFSYRGANLWNSLPCSLRQVKSLNHFKQLLNDHFS